MSLFHSACSLCPSPPSIRCKLECFTAIHVSRSFAQAADIDKELLQSTTCFDHKIRTVYVSHLVRECRSIRFELFNFRTLMFLLLKYMFFDLCSKRLGNIKKNYTKYYACLVPLIWQHISLQILVSVLKIIYSSQFSSACILIPSSLIQNILKCFTYSPRDFHRISPSFFFVSCASVTLLIVAFY